ncbi:DUF1206 domain-containing protein [Salinisphaera aquimarina]|uniref:DUF1206 domain-containing protein n=1 Tax=Salinisphaera aquimarina TaxID=2094031 RepID=A0ABV7EP86_9GAMM
MIYTRMTVRWFARVGYGARGLVYLVMGALALHAALEFEQARDVRGAMREVSTHAGGQIALGGIAAGLLAYGLWRLVQTLLDVDEHGWGARALAVRGGLLVSALLHGSLAWGCVQIAMRWSSHDGKPVQQAVSRILDWPFGRAAVAVGGIVVVGAGIAHLVKAAKRGYRQWFDASPAAMNWIDPVSRFGLSARGLLFIGMGAFVIYSAVTLDPSDARGIEGVMLWVQDRAYGRILLGVLALGVMAFGAYSLIEAFVRRVGLGRV